MRCLPVRDDALLLELLDLDQTLALFEALSRDPLPGVGEMIPGARTILVFYRPTALTPAQILAWAKGRDLSQRAEAESRLVEVPVRYDGDDLAEVAEILGVTSEDVVAMHTGSEYLVGFTGFAPGFAYLSGGDPALDVPRRPSPRTHIPAGAVALAGTFSGVYPRESPGGWQLIGTTDAAMWDLAREQPALLEPGDRVRFIDVTDASRGSSTPATSATQHAPVRPLSTAQAESQSESESHSQSPSQPAGSKPPAHALVVRSPGMLTLFQDLGRPGYASMGVSASGALDTVSLREANRLVGNDPGTACLEIAHGGLRLLAQGEHVLAVSGAPTALTVTGADGRARHPLFGRPFALQSGEELALGTPQTGVRSYLAVRGGFDLPPVLGSLATDVLAGLGPAPLAERSVLPVPEAVAGIAPVSMHEVAPLALFDASGAGKPTAAPADIVLDIVLGPRTDWFTADAVETLTGQAWTVTPRSNRVGLRLEGQPLSRVIVDELPSEGTVSGALQIPANGQPVLFLADHPLTGGYPIIGAVTSYHLPIAGQLAAGSKVRFRPIGGFAEYSEVPS